ncbi:MAG: DUF2782 domain-containing protein [Wenzhouxiangellaceae bacterium]|nr:DUF2782 domain-containing protein [Wenzhouxiangellaceae bacterium]
MNLNPIKALALAMILAAWTAPADVLRAQQTDAPPPPPIREPLPPKVTDPDEQLQPEVRIRREADRTVEEYVSNGRVYMVRIKPSIGPAYYLVDTTGDGLLNMRHDRFEPVKPTYWKILEW